jgi:16S rRNA (cytosine1402-N4)-methyltransferase
MNMHTNNVHNPVLLKEVIDLLNISDGKRYLDCTFGAGGYSRAILEKSPSCKLFSYDRDENTMVYAKALMDEYGKRFHFVHNNFSDAEIFDNEPYDGIVLDLGVSSMQLDEGDRGFSFMNDGPLDMRMGLTSQSAADFVNTAPEELLADVIYRYGEERRSRAIARKIIYAREISPITTTFQLANLVRSVVGSRAGKIDGATRTFQAIRIYINDELNSLSIFLPKVRKLLIKGGRIVVVSFHSLEDGMIKSFFKENSAKKISQSKYKKEQFLPDDKSWLNILTKKPLAPSKDELRQNPRSRSAKLRVAEVVFNTQMFDEGAV